MWKKTLLLCFVFVFLMQISYAAIIHGNVYDLYLDKQNNAVVSINSVPEQTYVVKNGTYSIELQPGEYVLKADYSEMGELKSSAEENITIAEEGDYVIDLILFPNFGEEEDILNEINLDVADGVIEKTFWDKLIFGGFIAVLIKAIAVFVSLVIIIIFALKINKTLKKEVDGIEEKEERNTEKNEIEKIMDYIKSQGGRVTQKELRKHFMSSQARMSLILTELEHNGIIEKIKKGRGNVIILKKP